MLLYRGLGKPLLELLDVGPNNGRLQSREREVMLPTPGQELGDRLGVGRPRYLVPDGRGEELDELL